MNKQEITDEERLILATGTVLNYFRDDGTFDLFIIINEPNSTENIDSAMDYLDSLDIEACDLQALHDELEEKYFGYGCELLAKQSKTIYRKCN